jgi:hypothetical protein
MELIYLLPHPPPLHRRLRHWRCRRPASTCAAPPRCPSRCRHRCASPPPTGNAGEGQGGWVCQGGGGAVVAGGRGADVVIVVAVLATIVIVTTAIATSAVTAVVVSTVDAAIANDAVAGGEGDGSLLILSLPPPSVPSERSALPSSLRTPRTRPF